MAKKLRQIIKIDEDLCNGCGLCVPSCAEGALQIIDGKAKLVSDKYCDGLGACLGECPQGALSFETREAEDFDEAAAMEHVKEIGHQGPAHHHHHAAPAAPETSAPTHAHGHGHGGGFVCPSARTIDRTKEERENASPEANVPSELRQWPVKLYLVNPQAPYFREADILLAADCVPFAYGAFHAEFLRGKTLVTGCPKFDDVALYVEKLTAILQANDVTSITVLQMEVPCCSGIEYIAREAIAASGKNVPLESVTISLSGEVKDRAPACA